MGNNMSFHNDCAYLKFYKKSFKGLVRDYQISFNETQSSVEDIVPLTLDLFRQLIETFKDSKIIKARLVAKVNFIHVNNLTKETEDRSYHFASLQSEQVENVEDFYHRHMQKIAERLEIFNRNGSNLLIKNIAHIHIQCISF